MVHSFPGVHFNNRQAFFISGVIGIILFSAYSYFNSRVNFRSFILGWLFLLFIGTVALYVFYDTLVDFRILGIPLMMPFSLNLPVTFLITLLFRRLPLDVFTPSQ